MKGPRYNIFFLGGSTIICGGLTIGGNAEKCAEAAAGEISGGGEGAAGTDLKAGVVTRRRGRGGGMVDEGEGLREEL